MWIFKAWLRWSSRHWPPSSNRLKMIAGFMEFLLLLVTRLSLFAAWSFARQWIMKPFRLLIKWSVQLDLTQIPINSLAGELRKRPQILIVSAEFLASIEVVPRYRSTRNLSNVMVRDVLLNVGLAYGDQRPVVCIDECQVPFKKTSLFKSFTIIVGPRFYLWLDRF